MQLRAGSNVTPSVVPRNSFPAVLRTSHPAAGHSFGAMDMIERQTEVMDRSGLGFLPGITLAFVVAVIIIAAILLNTWWATGIALAGVLGATGIVAWTVAKMIGDE